MSRSGDKQREWNARQMKIAFSVRDRLVLEDLRRLSGLPSDADVIRLALQNLARHYDIDDLKCFQFQRRRDPRKTARVA